MLAQIRSLMKDESGATAIEYALLIAGVAMVIATALTPIGTQLTTMFGQVVTRLGGTP